MSSAIYSVTTLMLEACLELFLIRSLLGRHLRDLLTLRLLLIPVCSPLGFLSYYVFPNVFGWFLTLCINMLLYKCVLQIKFSECIFPFLLSYTMYSLIEALAILAFPTKLLMSEDPNGQLLGTTLVLLVGAAISCLPLNRLYKHINSGHLIVRLLLSYISLLLLVTIAVSKIDALDSLVVLPITVTFMIVLLIADITVMNQQHTITVQKQDIANYQTYGPMTESLIQDIRGNLHDYNNEITAIRMLPLSCTNYESLTNALTESCREMETQFSGTELLKINLPVVAGFVFGKIKEAEQKEKTLDVDIKTQTLCTQVPEYALIRILGILIDNALEASPAACPVYLSLDSRDGRIIILAENTGPVLSDEIYSKMFARGFTTKAVSAKYHGHGLANLRDIIKEYEGTIHVENVQATGGNRIRFTVEV